MGILRTPLRVKLFIGMLSPETSLFDDCAQVLVREYGPIDFESTVLPWENTNYYRDEMGDGIMRKFIFFKDAIDPGRLPMIKTFTNVLEQRFANAGQGIARRRINLDPGYVTEAKVVLATTKDFSHRIYIGEGLFAEVTLRYSLRERHFMPLDYTYSDYRSDAYQDLFLTARRLLRTEIHCNKPDIPDGEH
jgi:hypothetical protein